VTRQQNVRSETSPLNPSPEPRVWMGVTEKTRGQTAARSFARAAARPDRQGRVTLREEAAIGAESTRRAEGARGDGCERQSGNPNLVRFEPSANSRSYAREHAAARPLGRAKARSYCSDERRPPIEELAAHLEARARRA